MIQVVILSGMSGSGKSTAMKTLEDGGYFCVDNLPVLLLPKFLELCDNTSGEISRVALVIDLREREFFKDLEGILTDVKEKGYPLRIVFLDAHDEVLVRRFSETRRRHPLEQDGSVLSGIAAERGKLSGIKSMADTIIDTTALTVHSLRDEITRALLSSVDRGEVSVTLLSFGYRYGIPYEADLVMDVRFLPNPYFVEDLKEHDGTDPHVVKYVLQWEDTQLFLKKFLDMLAFLLPRYEKEGKCYLTVAVGCTSGRHRSVAVANELKRLLSRNGIKRIVVRHRDASRIEGVLPEGEN